MKHASLLRAYGWAVGSTAIALAARLLMDPVLKDRIPYATFYISVAVSAAIGGLWPGIAAALLGGLTAIYFFVPPRYGFIPITIGANNELSLILYFIAAAVLITLAERQRRAIALAERLQTAERALRQRFETTLAGIGDAVIATDAEGRITFMNAVAAGLTGWPAGEAEGQPIAAVFAIHDEQTGAAAEGPIARALREGRIVGVTKPTLLFSRGGKRIPIDDSASPILDFAGGVTGAVLVFRDITETRARESELLRQRRTIEAAHDAVVLMDKERRITAWNHGAEEMYGWTEREARGRIIHQLLQTRHSLTPEQIDAELGRAGRWDGDLICAGKDGSEIICASRQVVLRDLEGGIEAIMEINRDVTAAKRLEAELRRSLAEAEEGRRTLEAIMEHLPEGLAIADAPDGKVRKISRYGADLLGKPEEIVLNRAASEYASLFGLCHLDGKTPARSEEAPLRRALVGGEISTNEEWVVRRPDGATLFALWDAAPIRDAEGRITGALIAWRDNTERRLIQEKLQESAKLESLGVLAGGIAHDFNNLLTGVLGNASLLAESLPRQSAESSFAQGIIQAAERAARLTSQMLAYSGRGRFVVEPVDLSALVRRTEDLIAASIPKNVELIFNLAGDLPPMDADSSQMQQLVMNLVLNGAEAIGEDGGRVVVATGTQNVDDAYRRALHLDEDIKPGRYISLEVSDNGCGIGEDILPRIFDPFFSTKFVGRGLGLPAVQGIVRGHGGAIKVDSRPGEGTTFRVLLPARAAAAVEKPPAKARQTAAVTPGGTVLVIDDEEIIRTTARRELERLGYAVIVAPDGAQGVAAFRSWHERISAVLLDFSMPGMSAEETIGELRKISPEVPIVLSSGFTETEAMRRFGERRLAGFLQKPYSLRMLAGTIGQALSGR